MEYKFKKGDYVEVITVYGGDISNGIKIGMRGYILENNTVAPSVNFVDDNLDFEKCCEKRRKGYRLYLYAIPQQFLKLVNKRR